MKNCSKTIQIYNPKSTNRSIFQNHRSDSTTEEETNREENPDTGKKTLWEIISGNKPALALVKTVLYDSHGRDELLVDDSPLSIFSSLLLLLKKKRNSFGRRNDLEKARPILT